MAVVVLTLVVFVVAVWFGVALSRAVERGAVDRDLIASGAAWGLSLLVVLTWAVLR